LNEPGARMATPTTKSAAAPPAIHVFFARFHERDEGPDLGAPRGVCQKRRPGGLLPRLPVEPADCRGSRSAGTCDVAGGLSGLGTGGRRLSRRVWGATTPRERRAIAGGLGAATSFDAFDAFEKPPPRCGGPLGRRPAFTGAQIRHGLVHAANQDNVPRGIPRSTQWGMKASIVNESRRRRRCPNRRGKNGCCRPRMNPGVRRRALGNRGRRA